MIYLALLCAVGLLLGKATDFAVYTHAATALTTGGWGSVYDPVALTPFKYHPAAVIAFLPFAWLPWPIAKLLWAVLNGAAVWDTQRRLVRSGTAGRSAVLWAAAFVVHALTWQVKLANITFIMLWLLVAVATGRRRTTIAIAAGVLVVLKPIWLILVPVFLLRRDLLRLGLAAATIVLLSATPFLAGPASGTGAYHGWATTLSDPVHAHNYPKNDNQSIMGVIARLAPTPDAEAPSLAFWLLASGALALPWLGLTGWIRDEERWRWACFSVVPVMLWIGPLSWIHHQILLWPLIALLLTQRTRGVVVALVLVWLFLNGTGELFLGRAGFVWASQAGVPLLAFPILLGAAAWVRPQRATPRPEGEALPEPAGG